MKQIGIVGSGVAGLLLLLNFEKHGIDPSRITVIDPHHNGGDLAKKWLKVRSNTTWRQIIEAVPSSYATEEPWSSLNPDEPVELRYVIQYIGKCAHSYKSRTLMRTDYVTNVSQIENKWVVTLQHSKQPLEFDVFFFCQGSEPKSLDYPYPSIPLEIALDRRRLCDYVKPGQHILVFGTAHSGPLVVKNLLDCKTRVTNFYATEKPFYFERDGDYDGIKQDAVKIADSLLKGEYPNVKLESVHNISALLHASKTADYCIYACGFEPRLPEWKTYDGETGRITSTAWGFGIAYPNRATDGFHWDVPEDCKSSGHSPNKPKVYWDVSVPAFQVHIQKQMPDILATLQ